MILKVQGEPNLVNMRYTCPLAKSIETHNGYTEETKRDMYMYLSSVYIHKHSYNSHINYNVYDREY
jgi:hypothetical protein